MSTEIVAVSAYSRGGQSSALLSVKPEDIGKLIDDLRLNRRHWWIFAVCSLAFLLDALDLQVLSLAAPAITRDWGIDARSMGFVFSATFVGMLIGSVTFGLAADRFGRRSMLLLTVLMFSCFAAACAAATTVQTLAVLRFFLGVGVGGLIPISLSMVTETMPAYSRGRMTTFWAIFLSLGNFVAAGAAALILPHYGWQLLLICTAVPGLIVLALLLTIPESVRFLLRKGRAADAARTASWLAMKTLAIRSEDVTKARDDDKPSLHIAELFSNQYRRRTILVWGIWFFYSISYFGLILFLPLLVLKKGLFTPQQAYLYVMAFASAAVLGRIASAVVIDRIGRRPVLLICCLGAAVAVCLFGLAETTWAIIVSGLLLGFFQDAGAGTYVTWTPELFPTRARSTSVGLAGGASRIAAIISPLIVGVLMADNLSYVFALFAAGYILTSVVTLLLRAETKQVGLEDAALSTDASSAQT
jgi:MFS transporter, putative metabolite:H+ symporter